MGPDRSPPLRSEQGGSRRGSGGGGRSGSPGKGPRSKRPRPIEEENEDGPRWWEGIAGRRRTGSTRREPGGWPKTDSTSTMHKLRRRSGQLDDPPHMGSAEGYQGMHGEAHPYPVEEYEAQPPMDPSGYQVPPEGFGGTAAYPVAYPQPGYGVMPRAMVPPYGAGGMPPARPLLPPQPMYAMEGPPAHPMYQAAPKMPARALDARGQPVPVPGYGPAPPFPRRAGPPPVVTVDESAKFINVTQSSSLNVMAAVGLPFLQNELMVAEARRPTPEEIEVHSILKAHLEETRRTYVGGSCVDMALAKQIIAPSLLSGGNVRVSPVSVEGGI